MKGVSVLSVVLYWTFPLFLFFPRRVVMLSLFFFFFSSRFRIPRRYLVTGKLDGRTPWTARRVLSLPAALSLPVWRALL